MQSLKGDVQSLKGGAGGKEEGDGDYVVSHCSVAHEGSMEITGIRTG